MDELHALTLGDVLREHARSWPEKTALVCGDVRLGYPAFDERVNRLCHVLAERGVGPDRPVLWLGQNCHRLLEGLLAAAKLGAAFCPANWRQSADEVRFLLEDLAPAVVFWQEAEVGDTMRAARAAAETDATWVQHDADGPDSYEGLLAAAAPDDPARPVDPAAPVLVMYTAAFTGRPRPAALSHQGLLYQNLVVSLVQGVSFEEIYLNCGPLFHIATFMTTLATFHLGGTNVFTARTDAEEVCRLVDAEKCTGAFVIGPTVQQIAELNKDRRYDLSSLALPTFGNSPLADMVSSRVTPWLRSPGGYGQTEMTGLTTFSAFGGRFGGPGRASPVAIVRIVDEDGTELPAGETGEIVCRGPLAMVGYLRHEDETKERQRDGWHHTNDLGRREPDGTITFVGPKTELIKTGAENVYPAEVEGALRRHPAVADVVVIGVPDKTWGQNVKAVVQLRPGQAASAEDLVEHVRGQIASYKKPKLVDFVEGFPRLASGMVDRAAVGAAHGGGGAPGLGEREARRR